MSYHLMGYQSICTISLAGIYQQQKQSVFVSRQYCSTIHWLKTSVTSVDFFICTFACMRIGLSIIEFGSEVGLYMVVPRIKTNKEDIYQVTLCGDRQIILSGFRQIMLKGILTCHRHIFALAATCLSSLSIGEAVVYDDG